MNDEATLKHVCGSSEPLVDIIFVHGLTGDAHATWQCPEDTSFWPTWLFEELQHVAIYTLGYPASLFEKWAKKEMDMFERAASVLDHMAALGIGNRPLIFVAHSLGGILTKILLRRSIIAEDPDCKAVSEHTRLVVYLATPHNGSSLANALSILPFSSKAIALLADDTGFLHDLNDHYRSFANGKDDLETRVYYEKYKTSKTVMVVTRDSADPGVRGAQPVALDKDHISICKPTDKDDRVYLGVKRHVATVLKDVVDKTPGANSTLGADDYTKKSTHDRRDLLEKLVDADREHEYGFANGAQNNFARRFAKTGLYTSAREDHDILLSEVETRFVMHVYHPLICKGESDELVQSAIQEHVMDPLTSRPIGNTTFSSKMVLSALYFLTEQCSIRWDPPA